MRWSCQADVDDEVGGAGAPVGAEEPAGPPPNPDTVVTTLKLESSSTVTSVPSDFFMCTS
jgi:hypothetical protein